MAMTAREAAWTALQRWRKNGAWSDAALNAVLQSAQLEPRDAALAARICYGTLQNLTLLDHYLCLLHDTAAKARAEGARPAAVVGLSDRAAG